MSGRQLSAWVKGADYPNADKSNRRFEIALCAPGEPVMLVLDPKNKADPHAVAIFSERGVQLGYLAAERAPLIGGLIRNGHEVAAIFQASIRSGAIIRIGIDATPTLPPERPNPPETDPDFYPDAEYSEDYDQSI